MQHLRRYFENLVVVVLVGAATSLCILIWLTCNVIGFLFHRPERDNLIIST